MNLTPEISKALRESEWQHSAENGKIKLSPSSMTGWSCQTKFLLSKVLNLEPAEADKSAADFGKLFHSYLETSVLPDDAIPELRLLVSDYEIKKDLRLSVTNHEVEFFYELPFKVYPVVEIHGIIDGIGTYDGVPCIIEHKTTASTNISGFIESKCRSNQALAYASYSGLRLIVFNVVQRTRSGGCNVITRTHNLTDDEVEEWNEETLDMAFQMRDAVATAINHGKTYVNRDLCHQPYGCQFCNFCQASLENKNKTLTELYKTKELK